MLNRLAPRGPDGAAIWCEPARGVALGHRRLKIMDQGPGGLQPRASRDWVLCYNGEIYNHSELKRELQYLGHSLPGSGDAEVVLAALQQWGFEECLERFDGMFAMAAWQRETGRLMLARDRFGEKPLYYGRVQGDLVFASDLHALRGYPGISNALDHQALGRYLRFGCVPGPGSIIKDLHKLPPGCWLDGEGEVRSYWQIEKHRRPDLHSPSDQVELLLRESIRQRLQATVPVGIFLSGGIDSSLVAALAQSECGGPLRTFTIGFEKASIDEAPFSRALARHLGCQHYEHYITQSEALEQVLQLGQVYDEPFADSSQIATCWVSRLARQQVKVVLTGDGSDELFLGYGRYQMTLRKWQARHESRLEGVFLRQTTLGYIDPSEVLLPDAELQSHELFYPPSPVAMEEARKLSWWDLGHYLPNDILTKVDRATMAVGLEARAPFLSRPLAELAFSLPALDVSSKTILKSVLSRYVPRSLFDRPKQGFEVPLGEWLRGPLRDWASDLLSPELLRRQGLFQVDRLQQLWREQLEGSDHNHLLWVVLMFQLWNSQA